MQLVDVWHTDLRCNCSAWYTVPCNPAASMSEADLLSPPPAGDEGNAAVVQEISRVEGTYKATYQRFIVSVPDATNRDDRQYSHMYRRRLQALAGPVQHAAKEEWRGTGYRFADQAVQIKVGEAIALVGIVTKSMENMPDILHELSMAEKDDGGGAAAATAEAANAFNDAPALNYTSEDDTVILEDRSGRIALSGAIDTSLIVPGAVMAFRGTVENGPVLNVDACCFPGFAPQRPLPQLDLSGTTQECVFFPPHSFSCLHGCVHSFVHASPFTMLPSFLHSLRLGAGTSCSCPALGSARPPSTSCAPSSSSTSSAGASAAAPTRSGARPSAGWWWQGAPRSLGARWRGRQPGVRTSGRR